MAIPPPIPGLVISYSYLWKTEQDDSREEGVKDRPCVVILAVEEKEGSLTVLVAPITHTPPDDSGSKIALSVRTRQRLGWDNEDSWVVITELNKFVWPGPDIRPIPGTDPPEFSYGLLPNKLFVQIKSKILELYKKGNLKQIKRT